MDIFTYFTVQELDIYKIRLQQEDFLKTWSPVSEKKKKKERKKKKQKKKKHLLLENISFCYKSTC